MGAVVEPPAIALLLDEGAAIVRCKTATALAGAIVRGGAAPQLRVEAREDVGVRDELRALKIDDASASWELSRLAFGADREPPAGWHDERPGRVALGIFRDGRLVAKATDREQGHWFGGRLVPACGIAGVVVAPELRGTGLARRVLTELFAVARARGAVIATLFRTSPAPYRRLGCEEVGALEWTQVSASALASVARPDGVVLRAADAADAPAVLEIYRTVARASNGLMERSGPLFDNSPDAVLGRFDGLTLAVGPAGVEGYAGWHRQPGYDASGRLRVADFFGLTPAANTALLAMLGSWANVAPTIVMPAVEHDPAALLAPLVNATVERRDPRMLRILDAPGAVAARGWPPHLCGSLDLGLDDVECPANTGRWQL